MKAARMTPLLSNTHGQDGSRAKGTPPRALFEDLPSAYTSITARMSRKYQQTAPLSNDLPLPPMPVAVREAPSRFEEVRLTEHSTLNVVNTTSSSLPVSPSFRQRLSQVFRSKKAGHGPGSSNIEAEMPLKLTGPSTQDHSGLHGAKDRVMRDSVDDNVTDEVELGRANKLRSTSEANPSQHYHNDERSCAPSSREQPGLVDTASLNPPKCASPSSNLILDAYNYNSAESNDDLRSSSRQSEPQMLPHPASEPRRKAERAISEIIEKHNRSHHSYSVQRESASDDYRNYSTGKPPKEFRIVETPVLRPPTSGLSHFDLGFHRKRSHPSGFEQAEPLRTRDFRTATISAPGVAPGVGRFVPLPLDPSMRLGPPAHGFGPRSLSSFSDKPSWASSYGETNNLLVISRQFPSVESGRDAGASTLSLPPNDPQFSSLAALPSTTIQVTSRICGNSGVLSVPDANQHAERQSQLNLEETITRDLRHLSGLSRLSSLNGSVYVLNDAETPREQETGRTVTSPSTVQQLQEDVRITSTPKFLPIAAFPQSTVVPGHWRLSTAGRTALHCNQLPTDTVADEKTSSSDWNEEVDDLDWETVHNTRTLKSYNTQISFAEYSSSHLMDPFRNVRVHPGDARYQHTYRIHSPANSDELALLPSYDFKGGGGFPNRNALTSPCPALYTYTHPSPLPISYPHPSTAHLPSLQDRPPTQRPMPNTSPTSAARRKVRMYHHSSDKGPIFLADSESLAR